MKIKYNDITPFPFLYKDKKSIVHCKKLEENADNCYSCPCPDCYATCRSTPEELNRMHEIEKCIERRMFI